MQVELDPALLATADGAPPTRDDDLLVLAICALGFEMRHAVVALQREAWEAWARRSFPDNVADALEASWDYGEEYASLGPRTLTVRVTPALVRQFTGDCLALDPSTALGLLGRPLRVLLENGRNDRRFLLAFAGSAQRTALERAERQGWVVFETAGGISELKVRAEFVEEQLRRLGQDLEASRSEQDREICLELLRTMMISDSDARELPATDHRSPEALAIARCLKKLEQQFARSRFVSADSRADALARVRGRFGAVLQRRAAENYAPPTEVLRWARKRMGKDASQLVQDAKRDRSAVTEAPGKDRQPRRHVLAALALQELPADVASVICMKSGRGGKSPATHDSVWNQLDDFQKAMLQDGFGKSFSEEFYGEERRQPLTDASGEVSEILRRILENV